jgi:deoxyribonuclease V
MPLSPAREHSFDVSVREARVLQERLAGEVVDADDAGAPRLIAGIDIGFEDGGRMTRAAVAVLEAQGLTLIESAIARRPTTWPYVPGLLSFREIPAALAALATLRSTPDLLVADGQGRAHPRRFGLASHLGWLLDRPTIGAAKSRLIGNADSPAADRGACSPLVDRGEVIGAAVRTRTGARPLYVSVGHRISLARAIELTLALAPRYRLPETTRYAHRLASPAGARSPKPDHALRASPSPRTRAR